MWDKAQSDTDNLLDPLKDGKNPLKDLENGAKDMDTKISEWDKGGDDSGFNW